jgi:hypothetical protein
MKIEFANTCHHIFPDGHRCGSPHLRRETLCYFHHPTRRHAPPRRSRCFAPLPQPLPIHTCLRRPTRKPRPLTHWRHGTLPSSTPGAPQPALSPPKGPGF